MITKFDSCNGFTKSPITKDILARMWNKSYKPYSHYDINNLMYLSIPHYNFEGNVVIGEMVVNRCIADITLEIFKELFCIQYPIERMVLVDEYEANDNLSMAANNSSAFNYRFIDSTTTLSNHSQGLAIDINPLYNPYVKTVNDCLRILPSEGSCYADRTLQNPYYIRHGDRCYCIFKKYGFSWGGDWMNSKDYQHFEYKGEVFPSNPFLRCL